VRSLFAALLFATAALADGAAHIFPLGPTTATPVEVHYVSPCHARGGHSVTRNGESIVITALDPQCVQVLPIPIVEKVKLPETLPAGLYRLEIRAGDLQELIYFVVRNAGPVPFEVHPFVADAGTRVRLSGITCATTDCSDITVRVGTHEIETLAGDGYGGITFEMPRIDEELVDVSVQKGDFVSVSPAAIYVPWNRYGSAFEQILVPVFFDANGANGSKWRSVLTIANPRPWFLPLHSGYLSKLLPCDGSDVSCNRVLTPKQFKQYSGNSRQGMVLEVSRPEARDLAMSLRIRDVSRQSEGYGTEVPVVREEEFIHGDDIRLLDVPLGPGYRVKVRIYMIDPVLAPALNGRVTVRRGDERLDLPFTLTRQASAWDPPYYAEVDLPQPVEGGRGIVEIQMPIEAFGWAFATVTNNETQQVTIVSPQ